MQRELWRKRWLQCVNELTSVDLQKESWLDKTNTNPHWSFVEFLCSYIDDLGVDNNYEYQIRKGWISEKEFEIIKNWHELLENYVPPQNDPFNHKSIIEDEDWHLIENEGQKAIFELRKNLTEREILILTKQIKYTRYK